MDARRERRCSSRVSPERTTLIVPDQNTIYLKFLDRQLHVYSPRPEEIDDIRKRSDELEVTLTKIGLDTGMLFVSFNRNPAHYVKDGKRDPRLDWFTDPKFVQAIAHSVDTKSMIQNTYFGYGEPAVVVDLAGEQAVLQPEPARPTSTISRRHGGSSTRAGTAIATATASARTPRDIVIEFELSTNAGNQVRERLCSILKEDWTKLGLKVNYRPLDFATLVEKLSVNFEWDAMVMGFTGGVEPHNGANLLRSSGNLHLWQPNQKKPATPWEAEIDRELERGRARARREEAPRALLAHPGDPAPRAADDSARAPAALHRGEDRTSSTSSRRSGVSTSPSASPSGPEPMLRFVVRRMLQMVPLLIGITFLSFVVVDLAPGDFFDTLSMNPSISPDLVREMKAEFGYGQPLPVRYARWLWRVVHLDLGMSIAYRVGVLELIGSRALNTVILAVASMVFTWALAIPIGIIVALRRGTILDRALSFFAFFGMSVPSFFLAFLLMYVALETGWFPVGGTTSLDYPLLVAAREARRSRRPSGPAGDRARHRAAWRA